MGWISLPWQYGNETITITLTILVDNRVKWKNFRKRDSAPDQELLQATSSVRAGGVSGASMHQYTSDEEEERTGLARLRSNKRNNPT